METNVFFNSEYVGEINPYQQTDANSCAIKSQQLILNDFGIPCTENELIQYSVEHGWYDGTGTTPADVGNLLETAGIPITRQTDANVFNLVNELSQGHKVIVGVDADELWHNDSIGGKIKNWLNDFFSENGMGVPNHALIVAGIDTSDPDNIKVIVTDPGSGAHHKAYPIEQFMDAWSDSSCYMVSTNVSAPEWIAGMENFNTEVGHIDNVAGVPYSDFQIFNDMSYGLHVYAPINSGYCCPMNSFMDAYMDFAHQNIMYNDIFSQNYMFNDFMHPDFINNPVPLYNTYDAGLAHINFNPMNDWNHYAIMNNIPMMTNDLYGDFLNQSIMDFTAIGDMQSAMYCEQQMMMLNFCDNYGLDFYDAFYI